MAAATSHSARHPPFNRVRVLRNSGIKTKANGKGAVVALLSRLKINKRVATDAAFHLPQRQITKAAANAKKVESKSRAPAIQATGSVCSGWTKKATVVSIKAIPFTRGRAQPRQMEEQQSVHRM